MWKKNKGTLVITSVVILLPMIAGFLLWNRLPDTLATHWGLSNQPDGFTGKPFTVIGIPLMMLALQWLCVLVTERDQKKQNQPRYLQTLVLWIIPVLSVLSGAVVYAFALGVAVNVGFWCGLLLGLLFLLVGNGLPKCRQNHTMGIRTRATLGDPENWRKTHRLAGFVYSIAGVVTLLGTFVGWLWLMIPAILAAVAVPLVYSHALTKK